jgi:hypothetical protein
MSLLLFVITASVLALEGAMISALVFGSKEKTRDILLGLPLASFANVLIVFAFTVLSVPLTAWSVLGAHVIMTGILILRARRLPKATPCPTTIPLKKTTLGLVFLVAASFILVAVAVYSFSHAVLLPTFQYDSATNWTMRSKLSFYDKAIAFDATEVRGMAKPQYPFLFHALQAQLHKLF